MNYSRKYMLLFVIINIFDLSFLQLITPNHNTDLVKNIKDVIIELTWNLNLPENSEITELKIYSFFGKNPECIATLEKDGSMKLTKANDVISSDFLNRLLPTNNGIIIKNLNYQMDHERVFFLSLHYKNNNVGFYAESPQTTLFVYDVKFVNFPSVTNILENSEGQISCIVLSTPQISNLKWNLNNIAIINEVEDIQVTGEIMEKYQLERKTGTCYISILKYRNINRDISGNIKCEAYSSYGLITSVTTTIHVIYPLDPPEEVKIDLITDTKVKVSWKPPCLDSGKPREAVLYKVELMNNDFIDRNNVYTNDSENIDVQTGAKLPEDKQIIAKTAITRLERANFHDLRPDFDYSLTVRVSNGAAYSKPSQKIFFKTRQSYKFVLHLSKPNLPPQKS